MGTEKLENSIFLPSTEQNVSAIKRKLFKMRFSLIKKKKKILYLLLVSKLNLWCSKHTYTLEYVCRERDCYLDMWCASLVSRVWLFEISWTVAHQAPLSMGILQARILGRVAMPSSRGSSQPKDWTQVSCTAGRCFTVWATTEVQED